MDFPFSLRDLEPKMRKVNDVKHDIFGRIGRN